MRFSIQLVLASMALCALAGCVNPPSTTYREWVPGQGWVEYASPYDAPGMYAPVNDGP